MRYGFGIAFMFLFQLAIGQETKAVKNKISGYEQEVYYVLKSDPDIKHGSYTRYKFNDLVEKGEYSQNKRNGKWETYSNKKLESSGYYKDDEKDSTWSYYGWGGQLISTGKYFDGERSGIWDFYENGERIQSYDFTTRELVYSKPTETNAANGESKKHLVRLNGDTSRVILERAPAFLGGSTYLLKFLVKNVRYPAKALENGISAKVIVSFWINLDGKISDITVLKGAGYGLDEEAVRVLNLMNKSEVWIPGIYNGQAVESNFVLPVTFKLQ